MSLEISWKEYVLTTYLYDIPFNHMYLMWMVVIQLFVDGIYEYDPPFLPTQVGVAAEQMESCATCSRTSMINSFLSLFCEKK